MESALSSTHTLPCERGSGLSRYLASPPSSMTCRPNANACKHRPASRPCGPRAVPRDAGRMRRGHPKAAHHEDGGEAQQISPNPAVGFIGGGR